MTDVATDDAGEPEGLSAADEQLLVRGTFDPGQPSCSRWSLVTLACECLTLGRAQTAPGKQVAVPHMPAWLLIPGPG